MSKQALSPSTAEVSAALRRSTSLAISLASVVAIALGGAGTAAARSSDREQTAEIEAGHFTEDPAAGTRVFSEGVELVQGTLQVDAETATVFLDDAGRLSRVVLVGAPVVWREELDSGEQLHARAGRIDYDFGTEQVLLEEDVVIDRGPHQITGPSVRYNLRNSQLDSAQEAGRIRFRITPGADSDR